MLEIQLIYLVQFLINISKVSTQLPSNKTKSRPLTVSHSHAACICLRTCLFIVCEQFTGPISDTNEGHEQSGLTSGWKIQFRGSFTTETQRESRRT